MLFNNVIVVKMSLRSHYSIDVWRDFHALFPEDHRGIVWFCEENWEGIERLNTPYFYPIFSAYVNSLFYIKEYRKVLMNADKLIELSLQVHLPSVVQGEDVFTRTVYQKGESLFCLGAVQEAEKVFAELTSLEPNESFYASHYFKCLLQQRTKALRIALNVGLTMYIFALVFAVIDFFIINAYYVQYAEYSQSVRNGTFIAAFILICSVSAGHYIYCKNQVGKVVRLGREKRRVKS